MRRPPRSTLTDTLCPYTPLVRARRRRAAAIRIDGKPRDDLVGDARREPFERCGFGGDRRIFAADDINPGILRRGRVEQHLPGPAVDELVARAQRPPLARDRIVGTDAEPGDAILQPHVEPVTIALAAPTLRRDEAVAQQNGR